MFNLDPLMLEWKTRNLRESGLGLSDDIVYSFFFYLSDGALQRSAGFSRTYRRYTASPGDEVILGDS